MTKNKKRKLDHSANGNGGAKSKKAAKSNKIVSTAPQSTIPFDAEDRILLIGEGDFSFARCIVDEHGCYDVTATCLDSKDDLFEKYKPQAEEHVRFLEDEGQTVLYNIDATKLDSTKTLKKAGLFDRIAFNFPHVGGKSKDVNRQVRFNQELLVKFFTSAAALLAQNGTILVTLFEGEPYTLWNIRDLARHSDLEVQRSFKFFAETYRGYHHSRTLGNIDGGGGWKGEDRDARTYVFQRKGSQQLGGTAPGKKRKKNHGDASSDED